MFFKNADFLIIVLIIFIVIAIIIKIAGLFMEK